MLTLVLILLGLYLIMRNIGTIIWIGIFVGIALVIGFGISLATSLGFSGDTVVKVGFGIIFSLIFLFAISSNILESVFSVVGSIFKIKC